MIGTGSEISQINIFFNGDLTLDEAVSRAESDAARINTSSLPAFDDPDEEDEEEDEG